MSRTLKIITAALISSLMILNSTILAYDDFSTNNSITATVISEKIGVLAGDISASETSITLEGSSTLVDGLALIGNELVLVSGSTITRAQTHTHVDATVTTAEPHAKGDSIRNISQNINVVFTPTNALVATNSVVITIPNNSPDTFGSMGDVAGSVVDTAARTFTITGLTGSDEQTISISNIDMPEIKGQYTISVGIKSISGTLVELGSPIISWANQIRIRAVVEPALILIIDKTNIDITANPSINNGENYNEKSVLSVSTNASVGYKILTKLEGKQTPTNAQLDSSTTTEVISSADSMSIENSFGYVAYNGDGSLEEQPVTTAGRTAMNNTVSRNIVEIKSDATVATAFTTTDTIMLPVTNTGAGTIPGNGSTEISFDSFINLAKHTIYYLLNIDFLTPSGEYEGVVTYTATPTF